MKLIYESGRPGRTGSVLPVLDVPQGCAVPPLLRRTETAGLPEVSELETVRHFTNLSRMNMSITWSSHGGRTGWITGFTRWARAR